MKKDFNEFNQMNNGLIKFKSTNPANRDDDCILDIRISVLPTKANLLKAYTAVAAALKTKNLSFTILSLDDEHTLDSLGWDGTTSAIPESLEYDRRGGEICIHIHCDEQALADGNLLLEKNPEEIKEILLTLWQQLDQNQVAIGYISPVAPFNAIKTHDGLGTPFSYRLQNKGVKPMLQINGSVVANQLAINTELDAEFTFTKQDLKQHKISKQDLVSLQIERLAYMNEKLQHAKSRLLEKISASQKQTNQELPEVLKGFILPADEELPQFLKNNGKILDQIVKLAPRKWDAELSLDEDLAAFIRAWRAVEQGKNVSERVKVFKYNLESLKTKSNRINGEFTKQFAQIRNMFEKNEELMSLFAETRYSGLTPTCVEEHAVEMQILYRNFDNFQKQKAVFEAELNVFQQEHENFWVKHKGKILTGLTLGAGIVAGIVGGVLTATGIFAPLGIPLTGLALYAVTTAASAAAASLITGTASAIYYGASSTPAINYVGRFFAEEKPKESTYSGTLEQNNIYQKAEAKQTLLQRKGKNDAKEHQRQESEEPLLHHRTNNPPYREVIATQTFTGNSEDNDLQLNTLDIKPNNILDTTSKMTKVH